MNRLKVFFAFILFSVPANAQNIDVQNVISSQIEALKKDNFSTAFTYAAPTIKEIFGTPAQFGVMVQNGYPMIHKPSSYRFTEAEEINGKQHQNVLIQDQAGVFYLAEYVLIDTEKGWKVLGVQVFTRSEVGA